MEKLSQAVTSVLKVLGMVILVPIVVVFGIIGVIVWIFLLVVVEPLTGGKISRWYEEQLFFGRNR